MTLAEIYNFCCVSVHAPKKLGALFDLTGKKPMTFSSSPSTSFCHSELQRALREQAFGIKNFTVLSSSPEQATAAIVLLDGRKITVQLTTQGYSIIDGGSSTVHETIEGLLNSTSALYAKKRQEVLMAKLAKLT